MWMAVEIVMPKWGLSMQEGTIGTWLKRDGDTVSRGEPVVEIETEKITNLVEAPVDGVLRILHPVGSVVPVTQTIAWIAAPDEVLPEIGAAVPEARAVGAGATTPLAPAGDRARTPSEIIRAMPVARKLAKDQGIDLATIAGSGPSGAITKEDVERAIAERSAPVTQPIQKVGFYSAGYRLDGLLYTPKGLAPGERRPGVVLLVGYTYLKTMVMPDIAKVLNTAGYIALVFDYRGFGDSEGPRHRLIPQEQVDDARAALTFLADQPQVDPARLVVVGISLGGAHAIATAALDQRVAAAIALEPPGDGERWLRSLRRHWEWAAFQEQLMSDRTQRARTGVSRRVDPLEIVVPDPDSRAFLERVAAEFPEMRCELPLESAEALIEYHPEALTERIAPRPLLLIHGDADRLVPVEESRSIARRGGQSCRLEVILGMSHFDWVMPNSPDFRRVADMVVEFLSETLPI
jgi:pimeloyl-ACP methyl ester carboxylesterase